MPDIVIVGAGIAGGALALQLPFRFEVGSLSDHLMSSAPE